MICAGIDAGSRSIKVVLFDTSQSRVVSSGIADQGLEQPRRATELFEWARDQAQLGRARVSAVVATGYGRNAVRFADTTITEITCHAQGVLHGAPDARTVIEIGGQDTKIISLEPGARVRDFAMNDRCAAGSGRFLEMVAARLGVDLRTLGELGGRSQRPAAISSMCVVFAETEIVGLLADATPPADIAAGVQQAVAARVVTFAGRLAQAPIYFTGGVALLPGMAAALESVLGQPVRVARDPLLTGALGAAVLAARGCANGAFRF
jgi:(R)-2-hydroxyacyl-CoA dehydratese activating ATPase